MVFFRDDESTDDYKIVELAKIYLQTHPYYIIKGRIYSLKTGKWKNLVARDESSTQRIVSLDLAKEAYGEVLQYEHDEDVTKLITLGVLGECLCGICLSYESHVYLWVMKVYGVKDSWTKLPSFSYLTDPWIGLYPGPLFVSNDGKLLFHCASGLVISNSKDRSSPQIEYISGIFQASIVVESFVSPFPPLALADNNEN
ncbi:hypothetical protein Tco_0010315 [Tanacetum coccineum]